VIKLSTPVTIEPSQYTVSHQTPLLLMGSCFTDHIGQRLIQSGFEVLCNPFGTLYNPCSVAACMQQALRNEPVTEQHLVHHDGLWHSWLHHSRFSHPDKTECLNRCNDSIVQTHNFLAQHPTIIITFGTAFIYSLVAPDAAPQMRHRVVANCHKLPSGMFERRRLSISEIVNLWGDMVSQLESAGVARIIFTVSPIRHMADGAHGNQLSKSTLLLAVDSLIELYPICSYFDSYEILLDELRDYRFYDRDMCHPSSLAVDIIWERFQQTFMTGQTIELARQYERQQRQSLHRPNINYNSTE